MGCIFDLIFEFILSITFHGKTTLFFGMTWPETHTADRMPILKLCFPGRQTFSVG